MVPVSKRIGTRGIRFRIGQCSVFPRARQLRCTSSDVLLLDWVTHQDSGNGAGRRILEVPGVLLMR